MTTNHRAADMLGPDWPQISRLYDQAIELPEAQRAAWLQALSGDEARLRPALQRLLGAAAQVQAEDFLATLPRPAHTAHAGALPLPGDTIGPYRVLRQIGEGGMGTVWLAQRHDGQLQRTVALKLPRLAWDEQLAQRLDRERNIQAALDHPHIARLFDAGLDAQGRPWLAMEWVDGEALDQHAERRRLDVRARVALLLQVAQAVSHAHSRLVIHRDLKPGNVLVNREGQVKLLDFGIAKLLDGDRGEATAVTLAAGRAMTPHYASPEQLRGEALSTASDQYSLAVLAFELLSGRRPHAHRPGSPEHWAQALHEATPPLASQTCALPEQQRALRGDLDAILQRALQPRAADRYATVAALADDLQRHLDGQAILARPQSQLQRGWRLLRRRPLESAVVGAVPLAALAGAYPQGAVLAAMAGGVMVALWQRRAALAEAQQARAAQARAEQVTAFIGGIFTQAVPRHGAGGAVTAADLLRSAAARLQHDLPQQGVVAAELGALIGSAFNELGEVRDGLAVLPEVVAKCSRHLGPRHPTTLRARWRLAEAANAMGVAEQAQAVLPGLVADLRLLQPPDAPLLIAALRSLAYLRTKQALGDEALAALQEAVRVATQALGPAHEQTLMTRASLSNTHASLQQPAQALAVLAPVLPLARQVLGPLRPHGVLLSVERNHADALTRCGRPGQAVPQLRQVLADQRHLDQAETGRVRVSLTMLGMALTQAGELDEARQVLDESAGLHTRLTGGQNPEGATLRLWQGRVLMLAGGDELALQRVDESQRMAEACGDTGVMRQAPRDGHRALLLARLGRLDEVRALVARWMSDNDASPRTELPLAARWLLRCAATLAAHEGADRLGAAARLADDAMREAEAASTGIGLPCLEQGLALLIAAQCAAAAGDADLASTRASLALQCWAWAEVSGEPLLSQAQALTGPP